VLAAAAVAAAAVLPLVLIDEPVVARAAVVAGVCLILWLSEIVPPYVPTFVLWVLAPLLLGPLGEEFGLRRVLGWSADPVLALFLGGFTLSVAAGRYGIDTWIARIAVRLSGGRRLALLALTATATATLSMWMSNIAAAAMMLAALRPLLAGMPNDDRFRRALLVGIALGGNFGGIATPIGSGPNAIAIAAVAGDHPISFLSWMAFALPLAGGLLLAGLLFLALRYRVRGAALLTNLPLVAPSVGARWVIAVFFATVAAWLSEPAHGASAALVALVVPAVLFGSGLLDREDLARLDWSTLVLIAGGIGLGHLLEESGLVTAVAGSVPWAAVPPLGRTLALCSASAVLAALMSNTAAATMLIPLATSLDPSPSTAVLIAVAASLGIPFVVSTPPNAMVYGEGGVRSADLLVPGLILMVLGVLLVSVTGPFVLRLMGIP
jgi:sodium-dependent dicarboxylate transporter 2/3/5